MPMELSANYQKPTGEIYRELESSAKGLDSREVFLRLAKYGPNVLKKIKTTSLVFKFFLQFTDLLAITLMVGAVLAFFVSTPRDGLIILGIVVLNAIIGFIQEYKAEKILAAFKKNLPQRAKAIREGKETEIIASRIVPGDILILEEGDRVSADARLIESYNLKTNDFSLTGESSPQNKKCYDIKKDRALTDIDNMVFMGTTVAEGEAKAIVVATGIDTEFGKIAKVSQETKPEPTPLQKELTHTGKIIVKIASVIFLAILIIFYFLGKEIKESMMLGIAIALAVVPEGLPAATSIALSIGAQKMLRKKALVKKLLHVESLGSVTTICTDKTGTLTTGKMSVVKIYPELGKLEKESQDLVYKTMMFCNNASLGKQEIGDPLELALLKFVGDHGLEVAKIKKLNRSKFEIPFSSGRKMMSVVNSNIVYTKGAVVEILNKCQISTQKKNKILKINDGMAKSGLRILALAYKELKNNQGFQKENIEKNLNFLVLVALEDPPREGVKTAIDLCHKAKIKVHMITGDYGLTALAIAQEIGLAKGNARVYTGEDLHKMDDQVLKQILQNEIVFARVEPGQKLRIVNASQEIGEVVAVTGDGVNDAPALVKADIGISMGKIGTEVAKEAADMILLDDHFSTIVAAIQEGRRIFDNAKKFVFYVFSSNSGELFVALLGIFLGLPAPLIAVQILAIDLGTDVLPSLALGVEKEEPDIMNNPPRAKHERIMNYKMLSRLLFVGLLMAGLALTVFIVCLYQGDWHYGIWIDSNSKLYLTATASTYVVLVFCQVANAFSCRSDKESIFKIGFFSNRWLVYAEIVSFILLFGIMTFPSLQKAFGTNMPLILIWILAILSFAIFLLSSEWYKKRFWSNK